MEKKILFTDLDGTLLNDAKEITKGNQEAVRRALEKGHNIVITTGRPMPSAMVQAKRLSLDKEGCYIISYNGGEIYDCSRKTSIYRKTVPIPVVLDLFERAKRLSVHIQTYAGRDVITTKESPLLLQYCRETGYTYRIVPGLERELQEEPVKVLAIKGRDGRVDEERILQLKREIAEEHKDVLDTFFSNDAYLEIISSGISKGFAVRWLCEYLQIPMENSVAVGDAPNDVPMLQATHIGAVMCNAFPNVAEYGNYVTVADNNHDGVAEVIERFLLQ